MIRQWVVSNFKSLKAETRLDIAALTIVAGANSSGKSSLLQTMLVVAQTLTHKVSSNPVVLNGALVRLGDFRDVKCADSRTNKITIGCVCDPEVQASSNHYTEFGSSRTMKSIRCEVSFDIGVAQQHAEATLAQPTLSSSMLSVESSDADGHVATSSLRICQPDQEESTDRAMMRKPPPGLHRLSEESTAYDVELDSEFLLELREEFPTARPKSCTARHFLPHALEIYIDLASESARVIQTALTTGHYRRGRLTRAVEAALWVPAEVVEFVVQTLAEIVGVERAVVVPEAWKNGGQGGTSGMHLRVLLTELKRFSFAERRKLRSALAGSEEFEQLVAVSVRDQHPPIFESLPHALPPAISEAGRYLEEFFAKSFRYLGPLRDEPRALYPLARTTDPWDVGLRGEHTAAVLHLHRHTMVRYVPSAAFGVDRIKSVVAARTLGEAVADWLQYLGVADSVKTRNRGKFGHEMTIGIPFTRRTHDLTHVGVGVSQVLPILVASLLAERDTTLIFEQPELHLHPRVQTLLADFFLSICDVGKQCIIETHSEYILSRLRLRTAMADERFGSLTKIYFVEKDEGGSSFREVVVNEYGAVTNWPAGFFDESQREASNIVRAATAKRRVRRSKEGSRDGDGNG